MLLVLLLRSMLPDVASNTSPMTIAKFSAFLSKSAATGVCICSNCMNANQTNEVIRTYVRTSASYYRCVNYLVLQYHDMNNHNIIMLSIHGLYTIIALYIPVSN